MSHKHISPLQPALASASADVQHAAEQLDVALMAGADTTPARLALRAAEEQLHALQAQQAEADAAAAAQTREAARLAEVEAVDQAQAAFAAAVEVIEPPEGESVELAAPVVPEKVRAATRDLARVQAALAEASKPHAAARAARTLVADRIAPKRAALDAIASRRAAGDERPGDAAEVSLLTQDLASLAARLAPLDADVAAAAEVVEQHRALVADAQGALQAAQAKAELDGLVARVRALETHFVAQVRGLRLEAQRRGHRNFGSVFLPSLELRTVAHGGWV